MAKIPDFSKFDLQGIVNSVKSIINPESGTPKVVEGDPIGAKIVQISTMLQTVADSTAQAAKNLTQINNWLNELYKDIETYRKLEVELREKQQGAQTAPPPTPSGAAPSATSSNVHTPKPENLRHKGEQLKTDDGAPSKTDKS